jgi:hypothetical protein
VSGIRNAFAADLANRSLDGFDRPDTFAAHRQLRDIGQGFAAETAIGRKDCIEEAAKARRKNLAEGIDGLGRGRLRNKASSNRR